MIIINMYLVQYKLNENNCTIYYIYIFVYV